MRELPSPTTEIVCETPLYLSGAAAASTSPLTSPRVNWAPLLHRISKVVLSKSGYGFTQEPAEQIGKCMACGISFHLTRRKLMISFRLHLTMYFSIYFQKVAF